MAMDGLARISRKTETDISFALSIAYRSLSIPWVNIFPLVRSGWPKPIHTPRH